MANPEHLDLLKQDIDVWNKWREQHLDTQPDLSKADLNYADLSDANLSRADLVETNLSKANMTNCSIYGISAWDVQLEGAKQGSLVITQKNEPIITVDNLKIAQFIYLLLNNEEI